MAMAQAGGMLASAILENTARKLRSAMGDEAAERVNVGGCLEEMLKTMEDIHAVLEGAEIRSLLEGSVYRWPAYAVQDMVNDVQDMTPTPGKLTMMIRCLGKENHDMGSTMKQMKKQLMDLHKASHNFRFTQSDANIQQVIHVPEATMQDEERRIIVGREQERDRIIDMLHKRGAGKAPFILAIHGEKGIGKTALVKCVFNSAQLKKEYYSRVWVNVSYEYDLDRIGESIISQLSGEAAIRHSSDGDTEYITKRLQELFNGTKVLLVLDDLWEEDSVQLERLKCMLSVGGKDSKVTVMVTTRSSCTAEKIGTTVYIVYPLKDWESVELFKLKSCFEDRSDKLQLRQILAGFVIQCMGQPPIIQAVGCMLKYIDARGWNEVARSSTRGGFNERSSNYTLLLMLSLRSMPPNLRLCFAYCGIFPKGHIIFKDDLIHQWIALSLIQPTDMLSTTQLAEEYITRLLSMSFLQPTESSYNSTGKDGILFTMNGPLHDFATKLMHNELIVLNGSIWDGYNEKCRYAVLTDCVVSSLTLLSKIRVLHCVNCTKMELSDDFFSFARRLRICQLKERSLEKLPDSICQLQHLGYLSLAGCSGLVTLPKSLGDLIHLLHINLSGCSALVNLPQSFGDLINLLHVDLSRCYGLTELPASFGNLLKLEHLDLSFCSCFKGIVQVLGGLINVKSLNLSHPCCHLADHWLHLLGLKDVWAKLTELRYLNLSMFLNPIFYQLPEEENLNKYVGCISVLSKLEHLDLSHNIFLAHLPESIAMLSMLNTLDLSGCARLERVDKWMGEMDSLKLIVVRNCQSLEVYQFVVCSCNSWNSNFVQLNDVSCKELEISRLEKVKSVEEVQNVILVRKHELEKLKLCWTVGSQGPVKGNDLLEEVQPPHNLQCLELHGYNGETCFPAWLTSSHLPNLSEIIMEGLPRCMSLPPLGLLPSLQQLVLRKMASITRIDDASGLSGGHIVSFHQLILDDMDSLEMLDATWYTDELVIQKCPKLIFGPFPPRARRLVISECDQVMSSWRNQGDGHVVEGPSVQVTDMDSPEMLDATWYTDELEVQNCNLPVAGWSLLHHLPALHSLTIKNCNGVATSSSEIFETLSSLQILCFSDCDSMSSLPQDLGCLTFLKELRVVCCGQLNRLPDSMQHLTSLQKLAFQGCPAINYLPPSITQLEKLKDLRILGCPKLKEWCESKENTKEFANIRPKYE